MVKSDPEIKNNGFDLKQLIIFQRNIFLTRKSTFNFSIRTTAVINIWIVIISDQCSGTCSLLKDTNYKTYINEFAI